MKLTSLVYLGVLILKFTRVVFGVAPSPYLINATIAQHLEQFEITHQETVCTPVLKGEHKILGVIWNVDADELVLNIEPIFQEALRTEPTKRSIVSIVSKIFDPLGILSPVVIVFKIFFQELSE